MLKCLFSFKQESISDGLKSLLTRCNITEDTSGILQMNRVPLRKNLKLCFGDNCDCCFEDILITYLVVIKEKEEPLEVDDNSSDKGPLLWINCIENTVIPEHINKLLGPEPVYFSVIVEKRLKNVDATNTSLCPSHFFNDLLNAPDQLLKSNKLISQNENDEEMLKSYACNSSDIQKIHCNKISKEITPSLHKHVMELSKLTESEIRFMKQVFYFHAKPSLFVCKLKFRKLCQSLITNGSFDADTSDDYFR